MANLGDVLKNLGSTKVTERQEGLNGVRTAFSKNSFLRTFHLCDDGQTDDRNWMLVFNALFTMVRMEKAEYAKSLTKGTQPKPTVVKRLTDAASTVRWLVEKAVTYLGGIAVGQILNHLRDGVVLRMELLTPIALDYAKAMKCLLSFRPHLEHIDDEDWIRLVSLAFNVVLGDPPKAGLDENMDWEEDSEDESSPYTGAKKGEEEEDEEDDELPSLQGKRKRGKSRMPSVFPSKSKLKTRGSKTLRQISVSLEQVEFVSILSILLSYAAAPVLSPEVPYLPQAIFTRLQRFLSLYPADSSLLHDYLLALSAILDHLALNRAKDTQRFAPKDTQRFARNIWGNLVGLWNTKDKRIKEHIIIVIRTLLPYLTADFGMKSVRDSYDQAGALWKLYSTLVGEAEQRRGIEGLILESLRLDISSRVTGFQTTEPFIAHTFRAGWSFDSGQAVSWAVLETQADCAAKLYELSESMNSGSTPLPLRGDKKRKMDNGISSIIFGIQAGSSQQARVFNLQVLLFLVDRHWLAIHHSLKLTIVDFLVQLVTSDDPLIQNWAFLCLAAIVHGERFLVKARDNTSSSSQSLQSQSQAAYEATTWDSLWTHSIRRISAPVTCRAASHAAYTLIFQAPGSLSIPLPSQRILSEIELFSSDLEVQGPSHPYDSVCNFLSECIRLASQDARLYRVHLEDKVVGWMIDHWKVAGIAKVKTLPQTLQDGTKLLQAICSLSRECFLVSRSLLPTCNVTAIITKESSEKSIRDFLLSAKLPLSSKRATMKDSDHPPTSVKEVNVGTSASDLSPPQARERKISAFFLRGIERLTEEWEVIVENRTSVTADAAKSALEHAVIALVFEALLVYNGIAANRHLVQTSAKLILNITRLLNNSTWNSLEKATVLHALEPLVLLNDDEEDLEAPTWETVLPPGASSGLKKQVFYRLADELSIPSKSSKAQRTNLLRIIWQLPDVEIYLREVVVRLRRLFSTLVTGRTSASSGVTGAENDDKDGFGPVRVVANHTAQQGVSGDDAYLMRTEEVCMRFIAAGPLLQSLSGEPTRDTDIMDAILGCGIKNANGFLHGFSLLLSEIRRRTFSLGNHLQRYLDTLNDFFGSYEFEQSERIQQLLSQFLHSILELWLSSADVRDQVEDLPKWLLKRHKKEKAKYRTERDAFIRFIDKLVFQQPRALEWLLSPGSSLSDEALLTSLPLRVWNRDNDIRIRFRIAILNARLFHATQHLDIYPSVLYKGLTEFLTEVPVDYYEHILSRFLVYGNIIVASSSVRRGPYWHLIETCLFSNEYSSHIEAILTSVSECLNLTPSTLFEAYASQMGFSMMKSDDGDIARVPPHLIGFDDRKKSAEFTLSTFAPTYITSENGPKFEAHCKLVDATPQYVYTECFGDIIGTVSAYWFQRNSESTSVEDLEKNLRETTYSDNFDQDFENNADGVALAVIRSLSDQVISPAGAIHKSLESRDKGNADTFAELVKYRLDDKYDLHEPNLPAFSISVVLRTLTWLLGKLSDPPMKAMTYHVLHGLFSAIHRSPVVNEQIRLVNALAVWISLRREDFNDSTLLHTLVRGSTTLLVEPDLAHAAQSMLEWAFRLYQKQKLRDTAFSNIIIRICSIAHEYARSRYDDLQKLGVGLMEWIDTEALSLSTATVKGQIHRALPTWPYPPIPDLAQLASEQSSDGLIALLDDNRVIYNKFRLVRSLYNHARQGGKLKAQFPKLDFWRLKDCIPGRTELQQEDIDAFASLLLLNHGDIGGITGEHRHQSSILSRYRSFSHKDPSKNPRLIREIVTFSLLQQLDHHSSDHVSSAYRTLRRIMAVLGNLEVHTGPSDYNHELNYLRTFPRRRQARPPCKLGDVLSAETEYDPFFAQLSPILSTDPEIARGLLPTLIHGLLLTEIAEKKYTSQAYRRILTDYLTSVLTSECTHMTCRQSVIDVILHLRHFSPLSEPLSYNRWLDLDYKLLAKNAVSCGAYTTALLFFELHVDHPSEQAEGTSSEEELLYEIYAHIDEPDGFYGIKTSDLHQFLVRRYHHEKQWEKALQFHGATVEAEPSNGAGSDGLLESFSFFGFNHLVMNTLRTSSSTSSSVLDYRLGWRTETWDLPERKDFPAGSSLYFAVRAVYQERSARVVDLVVRKGLSRTMDRLKNLGPENMTEIREAVQEIMCLKQINDWRTNELQSRRQQPEIRPEEWSDVVSIDPRFDFSDLETIMTTRISLLHSARQKEERKQIGNMATPLSQGLKELEQKCLIRLSQAARAANQVQIALNSIMRAHKLNPYSSTEVSEEFASVLWEKGEQATAIQYLQNVVSPLDRLSSCDNQTTTYRALLRARLGSWMATACLEKPTAIWKHYLQKAILELDVKPFHDADSSRSRATVYHDCAVFAEQQYHAILKSPDAIRYRVYVDRKKQEVEELRRELASTNDLKVKNQYDKANKILKEDSEHFRRHNADRDQFLEQALEMFARSVQVADTFDDDAPIRFCSLWFANFDGGDNLQGVIGAALSRIPSHKMVFLAHQLTARLSSSMGELPKSQDNLQNMVIRMCREHPFHSVYQLYCLLPERSIAHPSRRQSGRLTTPTTPSTQTERGSAAQTVFERLRADPTVGEKVADIETLCNASWQWAKYPLEKTRYRSTKQAELLICRVKDLRVPVPTDTTPLDPTMRYENLHYVQNFEKQFTTAGGVNLPKISICVNTENTRFKQLFKGDGNDDLRQDAVMEQVFDVVNAVLRRDRQTKRRELSVRGYKVIPLDNQSGLIEFVKNTTPLRNWLTDAHPRYRPSDINQDEVRNRHANAWKVYTKDLDSQKILRNFLDTRSKFRPVMRHYFTEKSKEPVTWFAMRLNYTRSIATTSIVGHILGLGDRHTSNILLDNHTGEVVHIDLGIAFDQGKHLPVPELVPFRMTADMVDGMGSSGTTGVFQRCAEETLRVLRDGSDVIMTVLEVFKHDPLHSWTLSDRKLRNAQRSDQHQQGGSDNPPGMDHLRPAFGGFGIGIDMSSGTAEEAADRALSSVARKLDKSLSVEYTVNQLIAEATDHWNLARIFAGECCISSV
ncbi:Serine/threonine-protein kinase TEL1 [Leucoagaricus sp. SymC.cos]|nr:Serine/threonine-protein kinase TEL1 [Leucoagaricus sp. SymC.cos]